MDAVDSYSAGVSPQGGHTQSGAQSKTTTNLRYLGSQRPVVQADSDGTVLSNFLEAQRPMRRVCFEKFEILVRKFLNGFGQRLVGDPEVRRSKVPQISLLFPARCA